ncbi:hypothetical protein [Rhodoferax sp.]|nr:hypothetical protein [Rhodoferax sp.]
MVAILARLIARAQQPALADSLDDAVSAAKLDAMLKRASCVV